MRRRVFFVFKCEAKNGDPACLRSAIRSFGRQAGIPGRTLARNNFIEAEGIKKHATLGVFFM